jgi:hypothetical protein
VRAHGTGGTGPQSAARRVDGPGAAMSSPMPAPRAFCMSPRTPEQLQGDFAIAELEVRVMSPPRAPSLRASACSDNPCFLPQRELEELRRKAANQEESLNKYRTEAEMLIGGGAGSSGGAGDGKANGMMKAWLRDAKKQSEELKALFEQSRIVSAESAAIAKRDYEKKVARLRQELEASQAERAAALADKRAAEEAARTAQTQVSPRLRSPRPGSAPQTHRWAASPFLPRPQSAASSWRW